MRKQKRKTHDDVVGHFQKRCLERIGVILNQRKLKQLMDSGSLTHLFKQSNSKTHFCLRRELYDDGKKMLQFDVELVYDRIRHAFVTVWKFGTEKPMF